MLRTLIYTNEHSNIFTDLHAFLRDQLEVQTGPAEYERNGTETDFPGLLSGTHYQLNSSIDNVS